MDDETIKQLVDIAPAYSIPTVRKKVDKIARYLIEDCLLCGEINAGVAFDQFIKSLCSLLYKYDDTLDASERLDVLEDQVDAVGSIVRLYAGQSLDRHIILEIVHKFVTWKDKLKHGTVFVPWMAKDDPEWAAVQIVEVSRIVAKNGYRYLVTFKAYSGRACGLKWSGTYSPTAARYLGRKLGFPRFSDKPSNPYDISGMWFTTLLMPVNGKLVLEVFALSNSMRTTNRKLYKDRQGKCILNLAEKCFNCPIGQDQCRLGRRLKTFIKKEECLNYTYDEQGEHIYHTGFIEDVSNKICYTCFMRGKFNKEVKGLI